MIANETTIHQSSNEEDVSQFYFYNVFKCAHALRSKIIITFLVQFVQCNIYTRILNIHSCGQLIYNLHINMQFPKHFKIVLRNMQTTSLSKHIYKCEKVTSSLKR